MERSLNVIDLLLDSAIDSIKLVPFLFLTYLLMEFLEHKAGARSRKVMAGTGKTGPVIGAVFGMFPQCGFSAAASGLYAGRVITVGTLMAVFLSTSDEMLPIMISKQVSPAVIGKILICKVVVAVIAGFAVDLGMRALGKTQGTEHIHDLCEKEHCECENHWVKSSIRHTWQVFVFIFIASFVLNVLIAIIGKQTIAAFVSRNEAISIVLVGLVGLIPNCAASVVITELLLTGMIPFGAAMTGLLVGSGVGILVLFRMNRHVKENIAIVGILYAVSVIAGFILNV